jgi:hypothetical protein
VNISGGVSVTYVYVSRPNVISGVLIQIDKHACVAFYGRHKLGIE